MEQWDESSRLFHCIRQLADLRRTNRALAYGSHQQKYLSDATYAFTRCYRNSRVFTLLNQGDATTITVANVDLPDGVHRCVLSGTDVRVENGTIHNLPLAAKGAVVLSVIAPPVEGTTIMKFQINNFFTRPGERIAVTGDVPELGCWDLRKSAALEYINGDKRVRPVMVGSRNHQWRHRKLDQRFASLIVTSNWCRDRIARFLCLRILSG